MSILFFILMQSYPASPGFNSADSDEKALAIADQVMEAMGGYEAYNQTRYITWRFFGRRLHLWDKWTGDIRFETDKMLVLMNIHTKKGRAFEGGTEITDPEALEKALQGGYEAWINDSYWLVMPYKLKDSGLTLKYKGETDFDGRPADVLILTFNEVGVTPENKYEIVVPRDSHLVEEWAFFQTAGDAEPKFKTPWANWQKLGQIMLSEDRGKWKHSDVRVLDTVPNEVFKEPIAWP